MQQLQKIQPIKRKQVVNQSSKNNKGVWKITVGMRYLVFSIYQIAS